MLPFFGPSDESHAVGLAADKATEPWNYASPYFYASYGSTYNRLTETTEEAVRFSRSEADPYVGVKDTWTYASKDEAPDWRAEGAKDMSTLQTLGVARIACHDPDFPQRGREMSVRLPSTGRDMKFNCWLQPGTAPLVYIAPGLGAHRLSLTPLSMAECLYLRGFSVVTTTSIFHPEFMERASTSALPAYPPADCHDLLVALTEIDRALEHKRPGKYGKRALVGCSMGAFQTLYLAAHEKKEGAGLLRFDRYVAIDTPVQLLHGVTCLDRFLNAPLAWPSGERQARVNNAIHKAEKMDTLSSTSVSDLPFERAESQFLIGLTFRMTLRDAIYSSQTRQNMGVVRTPLSRWRREPCYQEILGFSYRDYFRRFVVPYYRQRGIGIPDFVREGNLMSCESSLRAQPKVRVLINRNDFLLTSQDVSWLESTFGPSRLKEFPDGGHLGNLGSERVQKALVESLRGLQ
jgi:pimeloyl-ACP methyl ester carboxylesterase